MFKANCRASFPGMEYYMSDKPPKCPICGATLHMVDGDSPEYARELKEKLAEVHEKNLRLMGRRREQ
jgi:transcription initiation factor IIE alpha subunit